MKSQKREHAETKKTASALLRILQVLLKHSVSCDWRKIDRGTNTDCGPKGGTKGRGRPFYKNLDVVLLRIDIPGN